MFCFATVKYLLRETGIETYTTWRSPIRALSPQSLTLQLSKILNSKSWLICHCKFQLLLPNITCKWLAVTFFSLIENLVSRFGLQIRNNSMPSYGCHKCVTKATPSWALTSTTRSAEKILFEEQQQNAKKGVFFQGKRKPNHLYRLDK